MKLTNKYNLPQPIVDAVKNDDYTKGSADISVTGLLQPPRMSALTRKHWAEIEEDVSDKIWALFGKAVHGILEKREQAGTAEERLYMKVRGIQLPGSSEAVEWTVSGQMDRTVVKDQLLQDYKVTSIYKIKDGMPLEYEQQLNMYLELLRANGRNVVKAEIVAILRDWSSSMARRDSSYPQSQVLVLPVPVWTPAKAQAFLAERVAMHQRARLELPECTREDRWARDDKFAVMKKGGKKALRLYDDYVEASEHANSSKDLFLEERPGESVRCADWCSVAKFCDQFQKSKRQAFGSTPKAAFGGVVTHEALDLGLKLVKQGDQANE